MQPVWLTCTDLCLPAPPPAAARKAISAKSELYLFVCCLANIYAISKTTPKSSLNAQSCGCNSINERAIIRVATLPASLPTLPNRLAGYINTHTPEREGERERPKAGAGAELPQLPQRQRAAVTKWRTDNRIVRLCVCLCVWGLVYLLQTIPRLTASLIDPSQ